MKLFHASSAWKFSWTRKKRTRFGRARVRNKQKADKLLPEQSRLYRRSNWLREIERASYKVTAGFAEIPVPLLLQLPPVRINGRLRSPLLSTKSPDRIGRHATKRRKATEGQRLSPQGKEELRMLLKIHSTRLPSCSPPLKPSSSSSSFSYISSSSSFSFFIFLLFLLISIAHSSTSLSLFLFSSISHGSVCLTDLYLFPSSSSKRVGFTKIVSLEIFIRLDQLFRFRGIHPYYRKSIDSQRYERNCSLELLFLQLNLRQRTCTLSFESLPQLRLFFPNQSPQRRETVTITRGLKVLKISFQWNISNVVLHCFIIRQL